ncbi:MULTISPECIES: hypothetical protein [unclassified Variovorax]|uniref:hypothetical protein n=1 Tax=unclassified Variovorax TaxID=663243 RepID=UPI0012EED373|nr:MULTISPECIES: hypothetical protein [unclassified Variovorax]
MELRLSGDGSLNNLRIVLAPLPVASVEIFHARSVGDERRTLDALPEGPAIVIDPL